MADIVCPEIRSRMMAGIRGRNTKPEILLRSGLHRRGLRFTVKSKLPGKPDLVLPRHRVVVFFHGCFWHGHDCPLFKLPATRTDFWKEKIGKNRERDMRILASLVIDGWRVAVLRECAIRGAGKRPWDTVCDDFTDWIRGRQDSTLEIAAIDLKSAHY